MSEVTRVTTSKWVVRLLGSACTAGVIVGAVSGAPAAQAPRTVQDGVFTEAQAARGGAIYGETCASCHGEALRGAQGPPLVGELFLGRWRSDPVGALVDKIRHTMPPTAQGSITPQQSVDLTAHILKIGGLPSGGVELPAAPEALGRITWPLAPAGAASTDVLASAAQVRAYPPLGNMSQLMRGIFFPNSNLIFTVQTRDPAAPAPPPPPAGQTGGFSWVDWGAGIYGGWQLVDNAAIALADASPLMLAPGIRCENGRLAPVGDRDWIKFTEEMIAVSRRLYKLSQSRNQEAVSDATGDLADACSNCHRVYRDVRGAGRGLSPTDPANKGGRCAPRG
jgi:mono/diheme cytochrome c family protein